MSIKSVMPSSHLILCHPLLLLPPIPPSIRDFSNESTLRMRWPKYWSFSFSISPSKVHPGLISFRMDWLDLLAVQGALKSLLQHHSTYCLPFADLLTLKQYWPIPEKAEKMKIHCSFSNTLVCFITTLYNVRNFKLTPRCLAVGPKDPVGWVLTEARRAPCSLGQCCRPPGWASGATQHAPSCPGASDPGSARASLVARVLRVATGFCLYVESFQCTHLGGDMLVWGEDSLKWTLV